MTHACDVVQKGTPIDHRLGELDRSVFGQDVRTADVYISDRSDSNIAVYRTFVGEVCELYVEIAGAIGAHAWQKLRSEPWQRVFLERAHRSPLIVGVTFRPWPRVVETEETRDQPHQGLQRFDDLRDWLKLSYNELAALVGIAPSTVFAWRKNPSSRPRASTIAELMRLHAVVREVESQRPGEGLAWFCSGSPSPHDQLLDSIANLSRLEDEVFLGDVGAAGRIASLVRERGTTVEGDRANAWERFVDDEVEGPDPLRG